MFNQLNLTKKLSIGYIVIFVLMMLISVVVFKSISSIIDASKWVNHTYEVIRTGENLAASMVDMETGQRGFMVTGSDEYLEPFDAGIKRFEQLIEQGTSLTSDNPTQGKRWAQVSELKQNWLSQVARPEIKARRQVELGVQAKANFKEISSRLVGKQIFDGIRVILGDLESGFTASGNIQAANLVTRITLDLVNMETGQRGFLLSGVDASLEPFKDGSLSLANNVANLSESLAPNDVLKSKLATLQSEVNKWVAQAAEPEINARREMNRYPTTIDDISVMMLEGKGKVIMDQARDLIKAIVEEEERLITLRAKDQEDASNFAIGFTIVGTLIAMLFGGLISFIVIRGIMTPIRSTVDILRDIAEGNGDLTKRVEVKSSDEIGQLGTYFNTFMSQLQSIVSEVINAAAQLSVAADQMHKMTVSTSDGLNRQNDETIQVATAITEMSSTVDEVARNSQGASDAASNADKEAKLGNKAVNTTISTINELVQELENSSTILGRLKGDSENISAVLDVIKNIADQTNLLALNAAIEAARAGEQGRGFAVVADEVRNLAKKTQDSTSQIEGLITALQNAADSAVGAMDQNRAKATETVEQAAKAGEYLKSITQGVSAIFDMNCQIAVASEEQSSVAANVSMSISNIQTVSESTSAAAAQTSSSSQQVASLSDRLKDLVGQFRV